MAQAAILVAWLRHWRNPEIERLRSHADAGKGGYRVPPTPRAVTVGNEAPVWQDRWQVSLAAPRLALTDAQRVRTSGPAVSFAAGDTFVNGIPTCPEPTSTPRARYPSPSGRAAHTAANSMALGSLPGLMPAARTGPDWQNPGMPGSRSTSGALTAADTSSTTSETRLSLG